MIKAAGLLSTVAIVSLLGTAHAALATPASSASAQVHLTISQVHIGNPTTVSLGFRADESPWG